MWIRHLIEKFSNETYAFLEVIRAFKRCHVEFGKRLCMGGIFGEGRRCNAPIPCLGRAACLVAVSDTFRKYAVHWVGMMDTNVVHRGGEQLASTVLRGGVHFVNTNVIRVQQANVMPLAGVQQMNAPFVESSAARKYSASLYFVGLLLMESCSAGHMLSRVWKHFRL